MNQHCTLPVGGAALLLDPDGGIQLLLPKERDDADLPDHVQLAMAFCIVARSPVLAAIVCSMADAEALDLGEAEQPEVTQ